MVHTKSKPIDFAFRSCPGMMEKLFRAAETGYGSVGARKFSTVNDIRLDYCRELQISDFECPVLMAAL